MATYRTIAPTEDAVEAFITAELADAWTNNHLAAMEGDATATGAGVTLKDAALDAGAATTAGITWVGLRMAAASAGGVGTYCLAGIAGTSSAVAFGATIAGSSITPAGVQNDNGAAVALILGGGARSGTWRAMGNFPAASGGAGARNLTLWLRIS